MTSLNGSWIYESFRPENGAAPKLAVPWAPRGSLNVSTDAAGKVAGKLTFAPGVELTVSGAITPADGKIPEGVALVGEGFGSVNKIQGFWIVGTTGPVIVGTVMCVQNDLAKQPNGTSGPFVLFPACG